MKPRGFTLLELMVVIAVAAIMASLAAPSYRSFIVGQRVKTAANDFHLAAMLARSEAIKRNANVTLAASASGSAGWSSGWTVSSGANTIAVQGPYSGVSFSGPSGPVTYQPSGRLAASVSTMEISGASGSTRCVAFELSGMPRTSVISSGSCP